MARNGSWQRLLMFTAAVALSIGGFSSPSRADLVNGGFETSDLTGWTEAGDNTFNGVSCGPGATVAQGNCSYFAGPIGSNSTLSQSLATQPGTAYSISFSFEPDGGTPSHFAASFGGVTLVDVNNPAAQSSFQNFNFVRTATGSSTLLSFSFRDDTGFLFLDAVSVNAAAVPEPGTIALVGIGVVGMLGTSCRKRR